MAKTTDYLRGYAEGLLFAVNATRNDKPAPAASQSKPANGRRGRKPGSKIVDGKVVTPK